MENMVSPLGPLLLLHLLASEFPAQKPYNEEFQDCGEGVL